MLSLGQCFLLDGRVETSLYWFSAWTSCAPPRDAGTGVIPGSTAPSPVQRHLVLGGSRCPLLGGRGPQGSSVSSPRPPFSPSFTLGLQGHLPPGCALSSTEAASPGVPGLPLRRVSLPGVSPSAGARCRTLHCGLVTRLALDPRAFYLVPFDLSPSHGDRLASVALGLALGPHV